MEPVNPWLGAKGAASCGQKDGSLSLRLANRSKTAPRSLSLGLLGNKGINEPYF